MNKQRQKDELYSRQADAWTDKSMDRQRQTDGQMN